MLLSCCSRPGLTGPAVQLCLQRGHFGKGWNVCWVHDAGVRLLRLPISDCCLQVVQLWRTDLAKINPKAAESLADPAQYANLFPDMDLALKAEQVGQGFSLWGCWAGRIAGDAPLCPCCALSDAVASGR